MQRSVRGGTFTIPPVQIIAFLLDFTEKENLKNPFTPLKYGVFVGFDYGRAWFPGEQSKRWHTSYGGDIWLTLINKITTKYSCFGSTDSFRFMFELGQGF